VLNKLPPDAQKQNQHFVCFLEELGQSQALAHLKSKKLEGKHCTFVANVAMNHMRLDAQDPRGAGRLCRMAWLRWRHVQPRPAQLFMEMLESLFKCINS